MTKFNDFLKDYTFDKKICILGFGREGKSTYNKLVQYCSCKSITISDLNNIDRDVNNLPDSINLITGEKYQDNLNDFDIVFKSPGIVLKDSPKKIKSEITSETQLFFSYFRNQIIGITGTKGKSTVSSLIYHVLKESKTDCLFAGNIGIPVFDIADNVTDNTVIVCELSCHQLEYMTVSPHISVFLNLYEEHLDHYKNLENYYNAKKNIYNHQTENDILYCNKSLVPNNIAPKIFSVSNSEPDADVFVKNNTIYLDSEKVYDIPIEKIKLLGIHNHYNIAIAFAVCRQLGITKYDFEKAVSTFNPLAHRLEFVAEINGIRYYDDSISTACETAIEALKSVPNPGTILLGGMDRGIDYTPLLDYLAFTHLNIICMETSGKRIYEMIKNTPYFNNPQRAYYAEHLDEAVRLSADITENGYSVVLSPASASYGIFKNFEERGDTFKQLVSQLR